MGVSVLKFNQVFDVLLKQKPLESKFIDLLLNLKRIVIVNHLVSFKFSNFMWRGSPKAFFCDDISFIILQ